MLLGFTAALLLPFQAPSADFRAGDLVVYDPAGEIAFFDPIDGTQRDAGYGVSPSTPRDTLAWDPFRARVIFYGREDLTGSGTLERSLYHGDSAGVATPLVTFSGPAEFPECVAPAGDGRIYWRTRNGVLGSISLLRPDGSTTLLTDGLTGLVNLGVSPGREMEYHPGTNSLLVAENFDHGCSTADARITVRRWQLSPDGESFLGETACVSIANAAVGPGGVGTPDGFQAIDENSYLLAIRLQSLDGSALNRLWRIEVDPSAPPGSSLSASPYSATDVSPSTGGCWSSTRGEAIVLDWANDTIEAFGASDPLGGTLALANIASNFSQVIEVGPSRLSGLTASGDGFVSVSAGGGQDFEIEFEGFGASVYSLFGSATGFSPGSGLFGVEIPLVLDGYTTALLLISGAPPFVGFFGLLDPAGTASAQVDFPAGTLGVSLVGTTLHHAATVIDLSTFTISVASNPIALTFDS